MHARRTIATIPIVGLALPKYWLYSPDIIQEKIDHCAISGKTLWDFSEYCQNYHSSEARSSEYILKRSFNHWRIIARLHVGERPYSSNGWLVLGHACFHLGRYEEATAAYRLLVQISPTAWNYSALGMSCRNDDESIAALTAAANVDPLRPCHWWDLGSMLQRLDRHPEAIIAFERWLSLLSGPPTDRDVLFDIGISYLMVGNEHNAMASFSPAIEMHEGHYCDRYFDVADACVGHTEFALKLYEKIKSVDTYAAENFISSYSKRDSAADLGFTPTPRSLGEMDEKWAEEQERARERAGS